MKYRGTVGFWEKDEEAEPGIWKPTIKEISYSGDVLRNIQRFSPASDSQNDEFITSHKISIVADLYARQNWPSIKYVTWKGTKWKVNSVEEAYPRLVLEIGGVYNGTNSSRNA